MDISQMCPRISFLALVKTAEIMARRAFIFGGVQHL